MLEEQRAPEGLADRDPRNRPNSMQTTSSSPSRGRGRRGEVKAEMMSGVKAEASPGHLFNFLGFSLTFLLTPVSSLLLVLSQRRGLHPVIVGRLADHSLINRRRSSSESADADDKLSWAHHSRETLTRPLITALDCLLSLPSPSPSPLPARLSRVSAKSKRRLSV